MALYVSKNVTTHLIFNAPRLGILMNLSLYTIGLVNHSLPVVSLQQVTHTCALYYKSFTIIIYNHNDSSQCYKTMIMIVSYAPNLALAVSSVVNYDHK